MPIPTVSEVLELLLFLTHLFCLSAQGWGFCHRICKESSIFANDLNMVKLTILTDDFCKEMGTVDADNMGSQLVVNTYKELCGAFVNIINLTLVNYTEKKTEENLIERWNHSFIFSA